MRLLNIKKFLFILLTIFSINVYNVYADGYQVNLLSSKQTGMGHTGVALKLGAESLHFNPAGLAFLSSTMHFSLGTSLVFAKSTYDNLEYSASTNNKVSTPIYSYVGFKIYDNLSAGISFTTPFGNSLQWDKDWKGSNLIQSIQLKDYTIQPTIAYKISDRLSIGVGLMISYGNVNLSRALFTPSEFQYLGTVIDNMQLPEDTKDPIVELIRNYEGVVPVSADISGTSNITTGINVGIMYDISDKFTLGFSYRSKMMMKVDAGEAELKYASQTVESLFTQLGQMNDQFAVPPINEGTFKAELPLPSNATLGLSYRPNERLELALDLQFVGWKAYKSLDLQFTENILGGYEIKSNKNYKNAIIYRLGAQYSLTNRFDLRMGAYFDTTPIRSNSFNPETPGMNKLALTSGFSFEPINNFSIDFAFSFIHGWKRDGSYPITNVISKEVSTFEGTYQTEIYTASLGISYRF